MNITYKPQGYNSLSPYFVIEGAQRLVDLLVAVFDGKQLRRYDNADGTIMHVEVQLDDSIVMIGDASAKYPGQPMMVHVYVRDVHETFQKALKQGCEAIQHPVQLKGDPDCRGMFRDFGGNTWAIGTQLS